MRPQLCRYPKPVTGWLICCCAAALVSADASAQDGSKVPPKFETGAVLRVRGETRSGIGENAAREDGFGLSRLQLNLTVRPSKQVKFVVQGQDSRVFGLAPGRSTTPFRNPADLREGYVALGREDGPLTLVVGRRILEFGKARLLGGRDWSNTSPGWDGSTMTLRRGLDSVTLLAVTQVDTLEGLDRPSRTRFLYGAHGLIASWKKGHRIEPFFLTSRRPVDMASNLGGLLRTVGSDFNGVLLGSWDYSVLLAAQGGSIDTGPHRAWQGVWEVGKTLESAPAKPRFAIEWSYASGDDDPTDGKRGTYDTLHPSVHGIFGIQDFVSHRNIKILKTSVDLHPRRNLSLSVDFLDLRLASLRDGLYQLNGRRRIAPPEGGASSGFVGSELDFLVRYRPAPRIEFSLGASRFFAGEFVTRNVEGGESQTFLHGALTVEFF